MSQTISKLRFTPTRPNWQDIVVQAWHAVRTAHRDAVTRRQLGSLDDRSLSDIGVSRAQAQFLAEPPVWDVLR